MKGITADLKKPFESLEALYTHLCRLSDISYLRDKKIENYISEKVRVVGEIRRLAEDTEDRKALNYYAELILNKAAYIPHDVDEAAECLLRSCKLGDLKAHYLLLCLYSGQFDGSYEASEHEKDIQRHLAALKMLDDHHYAHYFLAKFYFDNNNAESAFPHFELAVEAHIPEALCLKAKACMRGNVAGIEKDGKKAFSLFKKAYERCIVLGDAALMEPDLKHHILYHLGCMYINGFGVLANGYTGRCLIVKASEKNEEAQKYCESQLAGSEWFDDLCSDVQNLDVDSFFDGTSASLDFKKIINDDDQWRVSSYAKFYSAEDDEEEIDDETLGSDDASSANREMFDPMAQFGDPEAEIQLYERDEDYYDANDYKILSRNAEDNKFAVENKRAPKIRLEPLDKKTIDKIFEPLEQMIGLSEIKKEVRSIVNLMQLNALRKTQKLPEIPVSAHMVFSGPPGTGKTTVARLIGDILWELGYLTSGHVVEVARQDLVGEYIGHTAKETQRALDAARGGIFFLDEAYTLSMSDSGRDFGYEAVDTINKYMEDHRDDMVVIAAGYKDEMAGFLIANPGLNSRFKHHLDFDPMDGDQLFAVYSEMCRQYKLELSEDAGELLLKVLKKAHRQGEFHKSNARGARDMFERMLVKQAQRLADHMEDINTVDLQSILKQDIYVPDTIRDGNITYLSSKKDD